MPQYTNHSSHKGYHMQVEPELPDQVRIQRFLHAYEVHARYSRAHVAHSQQLIQMGFGCLINQLQ